MRDLHKFTRTPTGEMQDASLAETVDEAVELWLMTHPAAGVNVEATHDGGALARFDRGRLQQVLLDLLQNACDAMPTGGRIRIATLVDPHEAVLLVEDEGGGIPAKNVGHIFDPLFTTKAEGMGLGLTVVKRIVDHHGGSIELESRAGQGTTFTIRLPRAGPPQRPPGQAIRESGPA